MITPREKRIGADELMANLSAVLDEIVREQTVFIVELRRPTFRGDHEFVLGPGSVCGKVMGLVDEEYGWPDLVEAGRVTDVMELAPGYRRHPVVYRGREFIACGIQLCEYELITGRSLTGVGVSLEPVQIDRDLTMLADWLRRPHVSRWWCEADVGIDLFRDTPPDWHAVIAVEGRPVGYLRWQPVDRDDLEAAGLSEIPDGAIDIDIFIGEPDQIARGVGPAALRLLLERLRDGTAPMAGLCTSVENVAAIRAFEKAGFRKLRQFDDPIYGRCWVLTADFRP